jgi:hypothetical protein
MMQPIRTGLSLPARGGSTVILRPLGEQVNPLLKRLAQREIERANWFVRQLLRAGSFPISGTALPRRQWDGPGQGSHWTP